MAAISGANIVNDGLSYYLDPSNPVCYSGTGTSVYNLASSSLTGGTLTNGVLYDYSKNGVMYCDGTNDYIAIPDSNLLDLGSSFTISAWIKINDLTTATYHSIYSSLDVTTNSLTKGVSLMWYRVNQFGINANSLLIQYGQSAWAWNVYCSDTNTINDTAIHHVAVTVTAANTNNPTVKFYLDGILKTTTWWGQSTKAAILYSTDLTSLRLGSLFTPANTGYYNAYSNINIYNVQVWKKELSATEITQIYNATKSRFLVSENIVTTGLLLNYDLSNSNCYSGTGTSIFNIANSDNNGNLISSPTFTKTNGGSLSFSGSSYITRSSALDAGQNFSATAWIYPTSIPGAGRAAIIGNGYPFSTDNGWFFCISNNNFGTFQSLMISLGIDNLLKISNSYVFQLNQWTHVAVTVSGGGTSVKLYANGVETSYGFSGGSARTLVYTNNEFHIGMRHSTTPERFVGNISQVQIYNTTLTASEILQNYNATKSRFILQPPVSEGLILNLDAGNRASYAGTGATWFDLSGNRLNGTLVNGPTYSGTGVSTVITCDGIDDYIEVLDNSILDFGANNFTVEYWFKKLATTTGYDNIWGVNKWNSGGGGAGTNEWTLEIGQGSSGTGDSVAFAIESGSTTYMTSYSSLTNALTQYHQLVGIRNGNKLELYLDGSQLYSSTPAGFTTSISVNAISGRNLRISNSALNNYYSNASSAIVRLYSKALSSSEVLQNFNFYRSRYGI